MLVIALPNIKPITTIAVAIINVFILFLGAFLLVSFSLATTQDWVAVERHLPAIVRGRWEDVMANLEVSSIGPSRQQFHVIFDAKHKPANTETIPYALLGLGIPVGSLGNHEHFAVAVKLSHLFGANIETLAAVSRWMYRCHPTPHEH